MSAVEARAATGQTRWYSQGNVCAATWSGSFGVLRAPASQARVALALQ